MTQRLIFKGRVQGVFFRATAKRFADELGVVGTVCNLANGDVEVLAQGSPGAITKLETALLQAFLCRCIHLESAKQKLFSGFSILT